MEIDSGFCRYYLPMLSHVIHGIGVGKKRISKMFMSLNPRN